MAVLGREGGLGAPRVRVFLGLGSSLGDRIANLHNALVRMQALGAAVRSISPVYESPHLGLDPSDTGRFPAHLNAVAEVDTALEPSALLEAIHAVEAAGGRVRTLRWGPRTIDVDILAYGEISINTARLALPHPGIASRAFVARPLLDLAPDYRLPDGTPLGEWVRSEPLRSQPIIVTPYVAWP